MMSRNTNSAPTSGSNDAEAKDLYDVTIAAAAAEAEVVNAHVNEGQEKNHTPRWPQPSKSEEKTTAARTIEQRSHAQPPPAGEPGYAKSRNGQEDMQERAGEEDTAQDLYDSPSLRQLQRPRLNACRGRSELEAIVDEIVVIPSLTKTELQRTTWTSIMLLGMAKRVPLCLRFFLFC
jgi:hypothetical protein